jgi:hypothetical protein
MCGFMQKQKIPITFVRVQCAAALCVKKLEGDIEIDNKEVAVKTTWNESSLINI